MSFYQITQTGRRADIHLFGSITKYPWAPGSKSAATLVEERNIDYKAKKEELDSIEAETAQQVADLTAQAEKAKQPIDERLLVAYNRIRRNVHNGLAVVTVTRDACGGCFNRIPPQRQVDIRQGKKLIVCEYCGRILVSE